MVAKHSTALVVACAILAPLWCDYVGAQPVSPESLEAARRIVREHNPGQRFGPIQLNGFQWSREAEVGADIQIILVSCALEGAIAAFRSGGAPIATLRANRITWFQVVDLDEDGISEVMLEEIVGSGTGVLSKDFVLYKISAGSIKPIWRAESYRRTTTPWRPDSRDVTITETRGFVRFDPSGAGFSSRMTYLLGRAGERAVERVFELRDGSVQEQPATRRGGR